MKFYRARSLLTTKMSKHSRPSLSGTSTSWESKRSWAKCKRSALSRKSGLCINQRSTRITYNITKSRPYQKLAPERIARIQLQAYRGKVQDIQRGFHLVWVKKSAVNLIRRDVGATVMASSSDAVWIEILNLWINLLPNCDVANQSFNRKKRRFFRKRKYKTARSWESGLETKPWLLIHFKTCKNRYLPKQIVATSLTFNMRSLKITSKILAKKVGKSECPLLDKVFAIKSTI